MPDQDEIAVLANQYWGDLLAAGGQGLALNPLVDLTAPRRGRVLWSCGETLDGYSVSAIYSRSMSLTSYRHFWDIGFNAGELATGLWVLQPVQYRRAGEAWVARPDSIRIVAHYDRSDDAWRAVTLNPKAVPVSEGDAPGQTVELSGEQKAVIARIARETDMLRHAARLLRDNRAAYIDLQLMLMETARQTRDLRSIQSIGAIVSPAEYLPASVPSTWRVSAFAQTRLEELGPTMYLALEGRPQLDPTGLLEVVSTDEAQCCPRYELVDHVLPRAPDPRLLAQGKPASARLAEDRGPDSRARVRSARSRPGPSAER